MFRQAYKVEIPLKLKDKGEEQIIDFKREEVLELYATRKVDLEL